MSDPLVVRKYPGAGPTLVVLHGGPAAVGDAAPLARGLAGAFRVLEPWQRGSGDEPLTVARHVEDLRQVIDARASGRAALIGESWGGMLALAYAAAHPESVRAIALVGCGTFDPEARQALRDTLAARTTPELRARLAALERATDDPAERLRRGHELSERLYLFDPLPPEPPDPDLPPFDARAHQETWADMLRLQEEGVYPAAFAAIRAPVFMLHGAYDPHPGPATRDTLTRFIPHLEYREWPDCGHSPWRERAVRAEFFSNLRAWLGARLSDDLE